jgi:hypothetical protein
MQGTLGIPFGERIMPQYIFANLNDTDSCDIDYSVEKSGEDFWFRRYVNVTRPSGDRELHSQWFGPFEDETECLNKLERTRYVDSLT